jgi:hypothetical protein
MLTRYNPSIRQELRYQAAPVTPLVATESLLDWLRRTGRLKPKETDSSYQVLSILDEIDEILDPEIADIEEEE